MQPACHYTHNSSSTWTWWQWWLQGFRCSFDSAGWSIICEMRYTWTGRWLVKDWDCYRKFWCSFQWNWFIGVIRDWLDCCKCCWFTCRIWFAAMRIWVVYGIDEMGTILFLWRLEVSFRHWKELCRLEFARIWIWWTHDGLSDWKMRSSKLIVLNGLYQDISLLYSEQR